jgi:hypothetical protein
MRRWIACGVAVGWAAVAAAADPQPVSVYPPVPDATPPAKLQPAAARPAPPTLPQTVVAKPQPAARLAGTVVPVQATQPAPTAAAPARPAVAADVTKPLSSVLETIPPAAPPTTASPLPTVPTMQMPAAYPAPRLVYNGAPNCAPCAECEPGSRWGWRLPSLTRGNCPTPCLDRLCAWFAWQPGPRVIPACTPTPYQPPLRHYFPATPGLNLTTSSAPLVGGSSVGAGGGRFADLFGPRMAGGCNTGTGCGRGGRCDPCHENAVERVCGHLTPRQFGKRSYRAHFRCPSGPFSDCAQGNCGPDAGAVAAVPAGVSGPVSLEPAAAVGAVPAGVIYPGVGGGYRFASPVYVPPARGVVASGGGLGTGGGLGGTGTGGTVGGNVGAVGPGTVGGGSGGTGAGAGGPGGR